MSYWLLTSGGNVFCIITFILVLKYYLILTNYDAVKSFLCHNLEFVVVLPIMIICTFILNHLFIEWNSFYGGWVDGTEILIYKNIICKLFNFEKQNGCDSKMFENLFKKIFQRKLVRKYSRHFHFVKMFYWKWNVWIQTYIDFSICSASVIEI